MVKDLATLIMAVVIILGSFAGVVQWVVSSAVAPLRVELQAMDGRLDHIENTLAALPEIRERLTEVETLLSKRTRE